MKKQLNIDEMLDVIYESKLLHDYKDGKFDFKKLRIEVKKLFKTEKNHIHKYDIQSQILGYCAKSGKEIRNYYCKCGMPKQTNVPTKT